MLAKSLTPMLRSYPSTDEEAGHVGLAGGGNLGKEEVWKQAERPSRIIRQRSEATESRLHPGRAFLQARGMP